MSYCDGCAKRDGHVDALRAQVEQLTKQRDEAVGAYTAKNVDLLGALADIEERNNRVRVLEDALRPFVSEALEKFKQSIMEFSAQVSAVAASAGASADANYAEGVMVFTMSKAGLMYEASVGGQGFDYTPMD